MRGSVSLLCVFGWVISTGTAATVAQVPATRADALAKSRVVRYAASDIVPLATRVRFTTMIVLPADERILDFICGDKEFWIVNGTQNFAYVKPAKPGARTNLNLVTASGNVYSFLLTEVTEGAGREPDLKVSIELQEPSMRAAAAGPPAFVPARQVEDYRAQVDLAKADARRATEQAQATLAAFRSTYPQQLRFVYRVRLQQPPFFVTAMYHDGMFTYIHARAIEVPTLYELKDGKPSLVHFDFKDGVYVVSKIVDHGYLTIGAKRLLFDRTE
jgi:type IV secretion system protein VirB9